MNIRGWDNENSKSVANVRWYSGSTNVYRIRHKGNCDIKFVESASGGQYYPEHLPCLGQNIDPIVRPGRSGPCPFTVGDKVQVNTSVEQLKAMQQGHGGWNPRMAEVTLGHEDEDNALHIALTKRNHLSEEAIREDSPGIHSIYKNLGHLQEYRLAISIACFLVQMGIDLDCTNSKGQTALSLLQDEHLQELVKSYKPLAVENNQVVDTNQQDLPELENLSLADDQREGYSLTDTPSKVNPNSDGSRRSRQKIDKDKVGTSQNNRTANLIPNKPVECLVCSELSEENVRLEPCNHKPAYEDCSSRMKKCLQCGQLVHKRVTKDGRIIPAKSRQPSDERMRYLECKIQEIEESHACSICMERKRNVVFLCGHSTCSKCADTLKNCHMCRKTITKKIPIY